MTRQHFRHVKRTSAAAVALALGLAFQPALIAQAEDGPSIAVVDPTTTTVEYGQYWVIEAAAENLWWTGGTWSGNVKLNGGPADYQPEANFYRDGTTSTGLLIALPSYEDSALVPGDYTIDFTVSGFNEDFTAAPPATLVVKPAALGIELRVLSDQQQPGNAIVAARFIGEFVSDYIPSSEPTAGLSPAGEWYLTVSDTDGNTVAEHQVERAAGDDDLATSFYWTEAEPEAQYTVQAMFTPTGASATNFTISDSDPTSFTALQSQRAIPTSTATATPTIAVAANQGFSLPLWLLAVVALALAGLGTLVSVLSVRTYRRLPAVAPTKATS